MPSWPASNAWPGSRNWPTSNAWPSSNNWPADFNGNFASLFPGAYQSLQTDLGLTYGSTPLATAGNTSTTVLTLTGTLPTAPVPTWAVSTSSANIGAGATFSIYYDGLGTTPAMTGVAPTAGVPVALTGAGSGLSLSWSAGTSVSGNSWKATCAALADQSGNGKNATQATASAQPVITTGLNGKVGLLFDGVNDGLSSTVDSIITALPFQSIVVGRFLSPAAGNQYLIGTSGFCCLIQIGASNTFLAYNGAAGLTIPFASSTPARFSGRFTGSTSDVALAGGGSSTGVNAGTSVPSASAGGIFIGRAPVFAAFSNVEVFAVIFTPPASLAAFDAAINSAGGYGPGAIAV